MTQLPTIPQDIAREIVACGVSYETMTLAQELRDMVGQDEAVRLIRVAKAETQTQAA